MKKATIAILVVAVLGLGAILVVAQKVAHGGRHEKMGGRGLGMFLKKLDLTEEQKTQVKQIIDGSREKVKPIFEAMKANREKLKDTTDGGMFDEAEVSALAAEQGNLAAQLIVEKERTKSQIFAILTDEQKAKAIKMRTEFENKFKSRMKGRKGAGDGPDGVEF